MLVVFLQASKINSVVNTFIKTNPIIGRKNPVRTSILGLCIEKPLFLWIFFSIKFFENKYLQNKLIIFDQIKQSYLS